MLLLAPAGAVAQRWNTDVGVSSQFEWTSNALLGEANPRGDGVLGVRPHIGLVGEGGQFKFSGSASLDGIAYLNRTQPNRIQPQADLTASVVAVPRLVFLDAGLRAFQTSANPFGARQETGSTTENSVTTVLARLTPRIEGMAGEHLRYLVRSDNSWTNTSGATAVVTGSSSDGYYGHHVASIERDPIPLGWRLDADHSETRYRDTTLQPVKDDVARATIVYALSPELRLGPRIGYERVNFDSSQNGVVYGFEANWQPSPRTQLSAFEEQRFFGPSWRLAFDHRTPAFAWNILSTRAFQTSAQSVFELPATDNVAALLDGMFTTRYSDPVERARAVQNFIASQGLPTSTLQPISLQNQSLSVVNTNMATFTLIGVRNTVSLSAFQTRTAGITNVTPVLSGGSQSNNNQVGASLAFTHRLTPTYALTGSADWSRISALEGFGGDSTTQQTARLRLDVSVAPHTTATAGMRFRHLSSNSVVGGHEVAAFVGLDHRF